MGPQRAPQPPPRGAAHLGLSLGTGLRVGLFGGSFDPAHEGHLHAASVALRRLRLDRLIWLVSPGNPLKATPGGGYQQRRGAAARRAHARRMLVSDAEQRLSSRYTIDTVRLLKKRFRNARFVWVMGADGLAQLHRWRGWVDLFETVPIAVVARPGFIRGGLSSPAARRFASARLRESAAPVLALRAPPAWVFLRAPLHPASSTALRNRVSASPVMDMRSVIRQSEESHLTASAPRRGAGKKNLGAAAPRQHTPLESLLLAKLEDDKAQEVVLIDLVGRSSLADSLIIASGRSQRHVAAVSDHVLRAIKDAGLGRARVEGLPQADWVLIDVGDVIVHVFRPEVRSFYNIEKIWSVEPARRTAARTEVSST